MQPLIKTENLKVTYNPGKENEFVALHDVSIEIYPEEYVIFFGPSGCGKSTLLYSILGLQHLSAGKLFVRGEDVSTFHDKEISQLVSEFYGIIFQNFNLVYSLNVIDNVMLPQVFLDVTYKERRAKAEELLARFGLSDRLKNLPNNLSGGQQQRVAIARSLINDPAVLLADEPVGNLDAQSAGIVMQTLEDINRKDKKTVILVTHDDRYLKYADRICYFENGTVKRVVKNRRSDIAAAVPATDTTTGLATKLSYLELQQLARAPKDASVPQLKAFSLTNYLVQSCTSEQALRLEGVLENVLEGAMTERQLFDHLSTPYNIGGAGFYEQTATDLTLRVKKILAAIQAFKSGSKKVTIPEKREHLRVVREFILSDYTGHLSTYQKEVLEKNLAEVIYGEMSIEQFGVALDTAESKGGVGLHSLSVHHIVERLKIFLAQIYAYN